MDMEKKNNKIQVSSEFVKCYEHFFDVISDMKLLDRRSIFIINALC